MSDNRNEYEVYIDEKIDEIKTKLDTYLTCESIVRTEKKFSCPNKAGHKNNDSTPSASVTGDGKGRQYWNCFVCDAGGDVLNLAHFHEGLPLKGPDFLGKTIPTLAKKLNVEWNPEANLTDAMREIHDLYRGNELISNVAKNNLIKMYDDNPEHPVVKYATSRGLTKEDINRFDLGYIEIETIPAMLSEVGIKSTLIDELGFNYNNKVSKAMFSCSSLIFTLRDGSGKAVGFASRNTNWGSEGFKGAKYLNTHSNRIFQKKRFLYGMAYSKEHCQSSNNVYAYEGYMDVVTSMKNNVLNCVAICSAAFTEEQLEIVYKYDIKNITFCLDGDMAGNKGMVNATEKIFTNNKMVTPFMLTLPDEKDPDDFFSSIEDGKDPQEEFKALRKLNIIEFKIKSTFNEAKTGQMLNLEDNIEEFFTWLIGYELNPIKRLKSLDYLAEYTGHTQVDLRNQLEYQTKMLSDAVTKQVDSIWYDMIKDGRTALLSERIKVLDTARKDLTGCISEDQKDTILDQIKVIDDIEEGFKNNTIGQVIFGWERFDTNIMIPKDSSLIMVGAYPNVGKSILMRDMAMNVIRHNTDMGIIYFSMDDPMKQTIPAIVANLIGVPINDIRYQAIMAADKRKELGPKIEAGFKLVKSMIAEKKLAIFDQSMVSTMGDIETHIDIVGEQMAKKNKKPLAIIDSLHSVAMSGKQDRRTEVMGHIRDLRRIANVNYMPVLGVAELRKGQNNAGGHYRRPTLRDFSETGDIEYRVTVGLILENELKEKGIGQTHKFWHDETVTNAQLPITTLHVDKNKEGFFQGDLDYETNPFYSRMREMTEPEVIAMKARADGNVTEGSDVRTEAPTQPNGEIKNDSSHQRTTQAW
jgi:DNA primase catalytic core